jgi:signal transduction histidine kinase
MRPFISNLSLKTKLLFTMVSLCFLTIVLLLILYSKAEKDLLEGVRRHTEDLSTAIQISLEQMSQSKNEAGMGAFKDLAKLKRKGIKEISVVNNVREVVASSNARLIGKKLDIKGETFKNIGNLTEYTTTTEGQKRYDILLPVVVGKDRLGYIHIATEFEDFADISLKNHRNRLLATIGIFSAGILFAIYLSENYTKPIQNIAEAAHSVARGDLSVRLNSANLDNELSLLTENFNNMVQKLGEHRELEKRLKEAEHLSNIGTLASGIAHEIRNPLNLINLSIDHLRSISAPEDAAKRAAFMNTIATIKSEIQRLDGMVTNFLNFGKPLNLSFAPVSISTVVDETAALLSEGCAGQKIRLGVHIEKGLPSVNADYKHIKTCLLNLFLNAMQAMPEGGKITADISSAASGGISITVKDTGYGIAPENMEKIFKPYFTTKDAGIGLGLAFTKRIVEEHGGHIFVESSLDSGTSITLTLPPSPDADKGRNA